MPVNIASVIDLFDTPAERFVEAAYLAILGRFPDPTGLAAHEQALGKGGKKRRRDIIVSLSRSPEARNRNSLIPMICREAIRLYKWRYLPWNRAVITMASTQASSTLVLEERIKTLEEIIRGGDGSIHHAVENLKADGNLGHLMEQTSRTLRGLSFALHKIEQKIDR